MVTTKKRRRGRQAPLPIEIYSIGPDVETGLGGPFDTFSARKVATIRDRTFDTLKELGIDPAIYHAASPNGSLLRSSVCLDHAPESEEGVAARLYEATLHYLAYLDSPGNERLLPGLAYRIGRLELVAYVIKARRTQQQRTTAGFKNAEQRKEERGPVWEALQQAAEATWRNNPRLSKNAVAKQIAAQFEMKPDSISRRIQRPPPK